MLRVRRLSGTFVPAVLLALMLALPAEAGQAVRELGRENGETFGDQHWGPGCETSRPGCRAIARVSGYQVILDGHPRPFFVKRRGWIVAFTLQVGKPTDA